MNWTNVNNIKIYDVDKYVQMGLFDYSEAIQFDAWFLDVKGSNDIPFKIERMLYGTTDSSVHMDMEDCILVIGLFCRYISYDSIFKYLHHLEDSRELYNQVKKILNSRSFIKYKIGDEGEKTRYIYALSEEGYSQAINLLPFEKRPDSLQSRRKKYKSRIHSYYNGYNFMQLMLSGFLEKYSIEYEMYDETENSNFRTDAISAIGGGSEQQYICFEEDTGTETPRILLDKVRHYNNANFTKQLKTCKLVYSYNSRCRDYYERYFPFLFSSIYIKNVIRLMDFYQCDIDELISWWKSEDGINQKLSIPNFKIICKYTGKRADEARRATYICANSIKRFCILPGVRDKFNELGMEETNEAGKRNNIVNLEMVQILLRVSKLQCLNPLWHDLVRRYSYSEFRLWRNKILNYLIEPLRGGNENLSHYHKVMLEAAEIYLLPTNMLCAYFPILLPEQNKWQQKEQTFLKRYYPNLIYKGYFNKKFLCKRLNVNLWLRNAYENKNREVYCEYTFASVAALFRVKCLLEEYDGLGVDNRLVTLICVVNGFNDAVNTALYLNYWKYISTEGDVSRIDRGNIDIVFVDYNDVLTKQDKAKMYRVWRYKHGRPAQDLADAELAGTGYGYAQPKGIYHNNEYGGCEGFYRIES